MIKTDPYVQFVFTQNGYITIGCINLFQQRWWCSITFIYNERFWCYRTLLFFCFEVCIANKTCLVKCGEIPGNIEFWKPQTVSPSDASCGTEHVVLLFCLSSVICKEEIILFIRAIVPVYILWMSHKRNPVLRLNIRQQI